MWNTFTRVFILYHSMIQKSVVIFESLFFSKPNVPLKTSLREYFAYTVPSNFLELFFFKIQLFSEQQTEFFLMQDAVCHRVAHFSSFSATPQPQPTLLKSRCVGPPGHIMHGQLSTDRGLLVPCYKAKSRNSPNSQFSQFSLQWRLPLRSSPWNFFLRLLIYTKRTRNVPKIVFVHLIANKIKCFNLVNHLPMIL